MHIKIDNKKEWIVRSHECIQWLVSVFNIQISRFFIDTMAYI